MNSTGVSLLSLSENGAKKYLLKEECYYNFDLPEYFNFYDILNRVFTSLNGHEISDFYKKNSASKRLNPKDFDNINHKIIANKDGLYAWRPLQLIHPALYVDFVNTITDSEGWDVICKRFYEFQSNDRIKCASIPVMSTSLKKTQTSEQINKWVEEVERKSIEKSLDFTYLYITDITDCYGSIYTHSLAWALHGKTFIKSVNNRRDNSLIGNKIDILLQSMSNGQTNGIPQGSVLMDFIAEIVLGYADLKLTEKLTKLGIEDYNIIRYRDDYRIFVNSQVDGDNIIKSLTEVLIDLGLKLNPTKTTCTNNLILGSIKQDKLNLLSSILPDKYLANEGENLALISNEKLFLQIYDFANKNPNSGQLRKVLVKTFKKLKVDSQKDNLVVLISIIVDLAYRNPSIYPITAAILSKIISSIDEADNQLKLIKKIIAKFAKLPNTGFMNIWLQRISYNIDKNQPYNDKLCNLVIDPSQSLWNSDWLNTKLRNIINKTKLIDEDKLNAISIEIKQSEVDAFAILYDEIGFYDLEDLEKEAQNEV